MNATSAAGPLDGVRVVELGSSLAGPFAALILAQLGAEVIKVEPPHDGDATRSWGAATVNGTTAAYETFNRGKKSVMVNYRDTDAVASLRRFVAAGTDVVMQNLRPGTATSFGLDAAMLRADNPDLIYCNLGAFGDRGPMRELPGYDPLMQAFGGIIDATGEADTPSRVGVSLIDLSTGMWGAIGVLSLLFRRANGAGGGVVDGSLFESSLIWMSLNFGTLQSSGAVPGRGGLRGPLIAPNGGFNASDGIVMLVVGTNQQFCAMCEAIERPELANDPRFADNSTRRDNHDALDEAINAAIAHAPRAYWVERLNARNVPCAPIHTLSEAASHPQTEAVEMVQTHPETGFSVFGIPLRLDGVRPAYDQAAPALGADNALLDVTTGRDGTAPG